MDNKVNVNILILVMDSLVAVLLLLCTGLILLGVGGVDLCV